jgi:hypothetical protein
MVKDIEVVFGKGPGSQPVPSENEMAPMWKKKSIFWELPYSEHTGSITITLKSCDKYTYSFSIMRWVWKSYMKNIQVI